ncbi:MAG TPA: M14 family zinc carboxypeptidase [Fimbriimonadaceae bacterium]|nr:M14 family zinc carboxypeptidase [Fimbriimonadaceae bacterium]
MLPVALFGLLVVAPPRFSFFSNGPYDPQVPNPEQTLGYALCSKHTVYRDMERTVLAIANGAKSRVVEIDYGKSTEGRPLRVFAVSSPENIKRLEQIRKNNLALANPDNSGNSAGQVGANPAIVWVNECIHGDETASFESGMALLYNLASSRNKLITDLLANTVVLVNPSYNPDGHERYVVAYNSLPNGADRGSYDSSLPSAFYGRANHYRFDMNRDRVAMSQAETRQEVALFLQWMPQIYLDQHGQVESYFFPPVQQSVNVNVDRNRYNKWTDILGRATAKSFDQNGWSYFIRNEFDFYNVCYLDTHSTLMGAIGMTQETDGGRVLATTRSDDTILTLRDGAAKHFTSALAVIESAAANRKALIDSFAEYKRKAATGEFAGKFRRVVVPPTDPRTISRFADHLGRTGIRYTIAGEAWTQPDAHDYWSESVGQQRFPAGSLVIDIAQPMGNLAKAWLEPGSDFEPEFIERQKQLAKVRKDGKGESEIDSYEFYDATAWCQIYAYDLPAYWCESAPSVDSSKSMAIKWGPVEESPVGYYLPYTDQDDILFATKALMNGFRVSMNRRPMKVGGDEISRGTFLFLASRNDDGFGPKLKALAADTNLRLKSLKSGYPDEGREGPGSGSIIQLRKPNIGIVMGNTGNLSGGPIWYLMEREFKLPFTPLNTSALSGNLDRFSTVVLTGPGATSSGRFGDWVRSGGCAVSLGNPSWAIGSGNFANLESFEIDPDMPGSLFKGKLDPTSFLSYGYPSAVGKPITIAVPLAGSSFYRAPKSGSVLQLSDDAKVKKLLSGWSWDTTEKDLTGAAWLHDASAGRGRVVLFFEDPTDRAQWHGLYKLLLNAMIIGPSA